ncbi:MAG: hypothetical protein K5695_00275 [Oscillospiraceae bacterium]|nr:hypothetical protein [Oscillospiraceae bacterium]
MTVSIYSRPAIEQLIAEGRFPENTAVITFYDPAIKRIDKNYTHVDYSGVCRSVFYSELDDLDPEVLEAKGYTYDTYFPEADEIAMFIIKAYMNGKDIICQCEYGQSRSAGCAAAILEYFYQNGISVFADYHYYPNQVVYHKIYDVLERQKRYYDNKCYFAADAMILKKHIDQLQLPESLLADYQPENSHSAVDLRTELEMHLADRKLLYHTQEEIINALLNDKQPVYASFSASALFYLYFGWYPDGIGTHFRYGCETIPVYMYFNKYYYNTAEHRLPVHRSTIEGKNVYRLGSRGHFKSLSFLGKLSWDSKRKMIDAEPLFITNLEP